MYICARDTVTPAVSCTSSTTSHRNIFACTTRVDMAHCRDLFSFLLWPTTLTPLFGLPVFCLVLGMLIRPFFLFNLFSLFVHAVIASLILSYFSIRFPLFWSRPPTIFGGGPMGQRSTTGGGASSWLGLMTVTSC